MIIVVRRIHRQQPELVPPHTPSANRVSRPPKKARQQTKKAEDAARQLEERRIQKEQENYARRLATPLEVPTILVASKAGKYALNTLGSFKGRATSLIASALRKNEKQGNGAQRSPNLKQIRLAEYEQQLTRAIDKRDGYTSGWEIEKRTAFVKARHSRATRVPQITQWPYSRRYTLRRALASRVPIRSTLELGYQSAPNFTRIVTMAKKRQLSQRMCSTSRSPINCTLTKTSSLSPDKSFSSHAIPKSSPISMTTMESRR